MSNLMAMFATAPRIKIYINNKPLAHAVGFNINISVEAQPVFVIGQYAPVSIERTMYNPVSGVMQIVRLISSETRIANLGAANLRKTSLTGDDDSKGADANFQAAGYEAQTSGGPSANNTPLNRSDLYKHLDPTKLITSRSFDIVLYMKVPKAASGDALVEVPWMTIKDCRITSRNTNISMGQLTNEPLSFQGLIAGNNSGDVGGDFNFALDNASKQTGNA